MSLLNFKDVASAPVPDSPDERLIVITPHMVRDADHSYNRIYEILFKGEAVYPFAHPDELFNDRLGHGYIGNLQAPETDHKLAIALVTEERIRAVVYAKLMRLPESDCVINHQDLPGDAHAIRTEPPAPLQNPKNSNVIGFYSVSNLYSPQAGLQLPDDPVLGKGAAKRLIATFHALVHPRYVATTISPNPLFASWQDADPRRKNLPLMHQALQHNFTNIVAAKTDGKKDLGQQFHLGNGAFLANYTFRDDRLISTNYVYPDPETRAVNKNLYAAGIIATSAHIFDSLGSKEKKLARRMPAGTEIVREEPQTPEPVTEASGNLLIPELST